ncbi:MAG: hypothetical protein ABIH37_01075 [archaeon]
MRLHFVARYDGSIEERAISFFRLGASIGKYVFSEGLTVLVEDIDECRFTSLDGSSEVHIARELQHEDLGDLFHEVDLDGDYRKVHSLREGLKKIYRSEGFTIT